MIDLIAYIHSSRQNGGMSTKGLVGIVAGSLLAATCGGEGDPQCESISRAEALRIAEDAKLVMLRRSTAAYASNFDIETAEFVRIDKETNGYVANVGFKGRDGRTLVALIHADCYIGWTEHEVTSRR